MGLIPDRNRGGRAVVAVESTMCALAITAVVLRIWARKLKGIRLNSSDWVCIAALFVCFGLIAGSIYNVTEGLGLPIHISKMPQNAGEKQATSSLQHADFVAPTMSYQSILIRIYFWTTATSLTRISASLLFMRSFPVRKFVILCWMFIALNIVYMLATYVVFLLLCLPWQPDWLHNLPPPRCKENRQRMFLGHGVINLIFDIIIVAMPMPLVFKLSLPMRRKMELVFVFAVGLGVCTITLTRTIEIELESIQQLTKNYVSVALLTVIEPFLSIVTCSLPVLRPVAQKLASTFNLVDTDASSSDTGSNHVKTIGTQGKVLRAVNPYAFSGLEDGPGEAKFPGSAHDSEKFSLDLVIPPVQSSSQIWRTALQEPPAAAVRH